MTRSVRVVPGPAAGVLVSLAVSLWLGGAPGPSAFRAGDAAADGPGPLSAAHARRPGIGDCAACHAASGEAAPGKCLACHAEIAERIRGGRGYHGEKSEGCGSCHVEHQGQDASLLLFDPEDFDHAETGFELEGAHGRPGPCGRCHEGGNALARTKGRSYLLRDGRCSACHPSPHAGRQDECLACHGTDAWR